MKILALDLASNCGYAYNDDHGRFYCGTWVLASDRELRDARKQRLNRRLDPRVTQLFNQVQTVQQFHNFRVITFEDVEFSSYTLACQLWASLRAAMWLGAFQTKPIFDAVPVGTLKRFATNHGGATKEMMCSALIRKDPRFTKGPSADTATFDGRVVDDNAVDATWLWKRANQLFGRFK